VHTDLVDEVTETAPLPLVSTVASNKPPNTPSVGKFETDGIDGEGSACGGRAYQRTLRIPTVLTRSAIPIAPQSRSSSPSTSMRKYDARNAEEARVK
jgi:hypothetical protein